jgi:hypothetical protein
MLLLVGPVGQPNESCSMTYASMRREDVGACVYSAPREAGIRHPPSVHRPGGMMPFRPDVPQTRSPSPSLWCLPVLPIQFFGRYP